MKKRKVFEVISKNMCDMERVSYIAETSKEKALAKWTPMFRSEKVKKVRVIEKTEELKFLFTLENPEENCAVGHSYTVLRKQLMSDVYEEYLKEFFNV